MEKKSTGIGGETWRLNDILKNQVQIRE